ncbi:MAG TPA: MBL fold metallo-hydrolase [Fibrobacteria bacterium]|nr:MBL fold metallo-hydrolase [Fibrobacteria bacterium]
MRITFLGTGTSHGIPVIGCACAVCLSPDPRNRRNRIGVWLHDGPEQDGRDLSSGDHPVPARAGASAGPAPASDAPESGPPPGLSAVIDVSSEFRVAALANGLKRLDFVLLTHGHSDHVSGLDDLRIFSQVSGRAMPIFSDARTLSEVRARFAYAFDPPKEYGGGTPQYDLREVTGAFQQGPWRIVPLPVMHGPEPILGFRVNDFAFITDVTVIPESTLALLEGLDVLVLDCLRKKPHSTHLSLDQAVAYAGRIKAGRTYFIHLTHDLEHEETERGLPENVRVAYDGLEVESA